MSVLIKLYDYFSRHRSWLFVAMAMLTSALLALTFSIEYHEDIFDFLPDNDSVYTQSMQAYTSMLQASRIVFMAQADNTDSLCQCIDELGVLLPDAITDLDLQEYQDRLRFVYAHLPYFLSDSDYVHLDSALSHIPEIIEVDKQMLSLPGASFLLPSLASDPLRIFPLDKAAVGQYAGAQSSFTSIDGYMLSADCSRAFAFYETPYGSTESANNAILIDSLSQICDYLQTRFPSVSVHLVGAPVVAVSNAHRIRRDSILAILLSLVLIIALLVYSFPRFKDIALILMAVAFGWLSGMAALALFVHDVSVIVLGIGSLLLGISVNYPLHLLVHQRYTSSVRQTLQEVLSPLIIGNITTIGAFLALIPLHSSALRQLGIFAAFSLLGTIICSIIFLPHLMSAEPVAIREIRIPVLKRWAPSENSKMIPILFGILLIMAILIPHWVNRPIFDANISHLNYLTDQQREDFLYFQQLAPHNDSPAYLIDDARTELNRRLDLWNSYWSKHNPDSVNRVIAESAMSLGLRQELFSPFEQLISKPYESADLSDIPTLVSLWPGQFDSESLSSYIALALSSNFDYLGLVCSVLVFFFLCLSFRSVILGIVAFLPMLCSWAFIVAIMQLTGLQFNIVNVILATFIFGQGDDYTIFVVEGLVYEYRFGRKMVDQYRQAILLSAITMLIAMGVLVFAVHPAMHSLGAVTLIGMSCVVILALLLPRLLFRLALSIPGIKRLLRRRLLS